MPTSIKCRLLAQQSQVAAMGFGNAVVIAIGHYITIHAFGLGLVLPSTVPPNLRVIGHKYLLSPAIIHRQFDEFDVVLVNKHAKKVVYAVVVGRKGSRYGKCFWNGCYAVQASAA